MIRTAAPHMKAPFRLRPNFWRSLEINLRVLGALLLRSGTMRYGHENLGLFWVIGEPLILIVGVMGMWTVSGQTHGHGIGVVPFALSGYSMIMLWRHLSGHSVHAIRGNMGLLFHRNVTLTDALVVHSVLEIIGLYEATEQLLPPIRYITLPFTGVFSMAGWLPQSWREVVAWSPLATRHQFRNAVRPRVHRGYVVLLLSQIRRRPAPVLDSCLEAIGEKWAL